MENRINILEELKALSPVLAGMEKVNVFTVPDGYFESLGDTVLMSIKEENGNVFNAIKNQPAMQVPQGYFESLAGNILNKIKAGENAVAELKELSPLLHSIPNKNVFTVPQGYFEALADNVLNKIKTEDNAANELRELSPMLYSIQNENVFTVPQGYFESLPGSILNEIKTEDNAANELKELSPMLYSIQNENVFTVPQGYFESLLANILASVQPQAKVVTMKRRVTTTVLKYAIAAVFTGVMALGVYKFTNTNEYDQRKAKDIAKAYPGWIQTNVDGELAKISDDDIVNFLTKDGVDVEAAVAVSQMQDKVDAEQTETDSDKADSKEIDDLLNQLDNNKTTN